jgi:hypothetical protein
MSEEGKILVRDLRTLLKEIESAIKDSEFVRSIYVVFGIPNIELRSEWVHKLKGIHAEYKCALRDVEKAIKRKQNPRLPALAENRKAFDKIISTTAKDALIWRSHEIFSGIKNPHGLNTLARKIEDSGSAILRKTEVRKFFNLSRIVPGWDKAPPYTLVILRGGLSISSPEHDLLLSACLSYNTATSVREKNRHSLPEADFADVEGAIDMNSLHFISCRQVILDCYLLIEAYMNGLASEFLESHGNSLSLEEQLYLKERRLRKGEEAPKFVSTGEKLIKWTKMISPRKETFSKDSEPFLGFMRIKEFRDSIVHLSESKVNSYRDIDYSTAVDAMKTTLKLIEYICQCISPNPDSVTLPFWMRELNLNGFFDLTNVVTLEEKTCANSPSN